MRNKVFFIGFNKCATKSLAELFRKSGYRAYHFNAPNHNLAKRMKYNISNDRPILMDIEGADAYIDMVLHEDGEYIEAIQYFKEMHHQYPNAWFIVQTRPMVDWITSRLNHKDGEYLERLMNQLGMTKQEVINKWKDDRVAHYANVYAYFKRNPKFMFFDIAENSITRLTDFLEPEYKLDPKNWTHIK